MSVRVTQDIAQTLSKELHAIVNEAEIDTLGIITVTGARVAFFTKTNAKMTVMNPVTF